MWLRTIVAAIALTTSQAWAGECASPMAHAAVPAEVTGQPYSAARSTLVAAGWQPLLDWNRMQHEYDLAEGWIAETGYFEVSGCSNTGMGYCAASFVDINRNLLRVITTDQDGPIVSSARVICDPKPSDAF